MHEPVFFPSTGFVRSFVRSFVRASINPFVRSCVHSCIHSVKASLSTASIGDGADVLLVDCRLRFVRINQSFKPGLYKIWCGRASKSPDFSGDLPIFDKIMKISRSPDFE